MTILGINYSPERSGIAPYTAGMAAGLRRRGHDVTVVTTFPHYPEWRVAEGYGGWSRSEQVDDVNVRRVRHMVPTRPTGVRRAFSEMSFGARAVASSWRAPDVVLCISPALLSSTMAIVRAQTGRHRPALGLQIQDLYSAGMSETGAGGSAITRVLTRAERWTACRVDGVAVIHDRFKVTVSSTLGVPGDRIRVIRNWTHLPEATPFDRAEVRRRLGWEGSHVVLHTGAMGEKQALGNVIDAARAAESSGSRVLFVLLGDGGQRRSLEQRAEGLRHIRFVDPLPGDAYVHAMHAADVLLVNEKPGVKEMAVPSKLTSYFSTGRPVLAASDPGSTTSEELLASGAGVRVDPGDPGALLRAAEQLCADHTKSAEIGAHGPAYCARVLDEETAIDGYEAWIRELSLRAATRRVDG